ncbi:unnamed protein product [Prunus armeniaca]|uniref:Uncharacterized protein n=1 Tax=Prunus armeniaca TaxID=36596 RepID=A0A6J5UHJ3_PRUAR|nr:unnamed protein product [Prunus armeniaca]
MWKGLGFFWCQQQRWAQCCPHSNSPCCCFDSTFAAAAADCGGGGDVDFAGAVALKLKKRNLTPPSLETAQRIRAWPSSNKINTDPNTHKPKNPATSSFFMTNRERERERERERAGGGVMG